ncbi:MAG: iron-molybdenum cofactor biosynthesis protein [candidate division Zixibacteria bacterium]|jgi:predicted Fe-Mo cluster-binding NifX family protein|nr:iron-molybdenum cofactor biosynthesis protein [candidate division Zixibacteria bacterium]
MRIAVASDDGVSIAEHFGRCAGFIIYEYENDDIKEIENRPNTREHHHEQHDCANHENSHGATNHSHESFLAALGDCQIVICRGMGRRAINDLQAKGINPAIIAADITAREAVELLAAGKLGFSDQSSCCSH